MKAITLWEPYATLMKFKIKEYETRSWCAPRKLANQRIAIHAAKRKIDLNEWYYIYDQLSQDYKADLLSYKSGKYFENSYGKILFTGELISCQQMTKEMIARMSEDERLCGDWYPGRYAWNVIDLNIFDEPIPAKGKQGLWGWDE